MILSRIIRRHNSDSRGSYTYCGPNDRSKYINKLFNSYLSLQSLRPHLTDFSDHTPVGFSIYGIPTDQHHAIDFNTTKTATTHTSVTCSSLLANTLHTLP